LFSRPPQGGSDRDPEVTTAHAPNFSCGLLILMSIGHDIFVYIEGNIATKVLIILAIFIKLHLKLPVNCNSICLNPNSHKPQGLRSARTVSQFKKKEWVFILRKMALILIVLLFAGIGLTLGQAGHCTGNCNCPASTSCSQSTCGASCGGSCSQSGSAASPCGSHCPLGGCGSAGGCHSCCGSNCAGCC